MPIDYRNYPPTWKAIRAAILERAGHKCEVCGVPNHAVGIRDRQGVFHPLEEINENGMDNLDLTPSARGITIVLTIAHLDHDPSSTDPARLKAMCQQCHLRYDARHHARNAAVTRRRKREQIQPALLPETP